MKAPQYNSSLRKRFLAFAAALVLLFALVFELWRDSSKSRIPKVPQCAIQVSCGEKRCACPFDGAWLCKRLYRKRNDTEPDDLFRCVRSVYDIPRGLRIIPVDVGIQPKQTGQG